MNNTDKKNTTETSDLHVADKTLPTNAEKNANEKETMNILKEAYCDSNKNIDEDAMLLALGFASFGSTKETKVKGNDFGAVKIVKKTKRQYRQFMHKKFHEKKKKD